MIRRIIIAGFTLALLLGIHQSNAFWQSRDSNYNQSISGSSPAAPTFNWQNAQNNTFLSASTTTNIGATNPAGANGTFTSGDVLIGYLIINALTQTITPPSGWTQGGTLQDAPNTGTIAWFWHVCNGSESGSFTFTWGTSAFSAWTLLDYQGVSNSTPIDTSVNATWSSASSTTIVTSSVTPTSVNDKLVLLIYNFANTTITVPANMTQRYNVTQNSGGFLNTASDVTAGSTSAQTETFTVGATFKSGGYALIALTP